VKKLMVALTIAGSLAPALTQAQVKIDVSRITCGEMLALAPDVQSDFAAFMSGWFAQRSGRTFIDVALFQKNSASVKEWCASNPSQSVLAGLTRAFDKK
jgi:hypothetical protein